MIRQTSLGVALAPLIATAALVVAPNLGAQNRIYTILGGSANDLAGTAVAGAGDIDKDGYPDLITVSGVPKFFRVYSGRDGSTIGQVDDHFGVVAGAAPADEERCTGDGTE